MGRYAQYEEKASTDMDLYRVDEDFDDPAGVAGGDSQADLMYAVNESAAAWRSHRSLDGWQTGF